MSRKKALSLGWALIKFATGTKRVGMIIDDGGTIEIVGDAFISMDERMQDG